MAKFSRLLKRPRSLVFSGIRVALLVLGALCALPFSPQAQVVQVGILAAVGLLLPVRVNRFVAATALVALPFLLTKTLLFAVALVLVPLFARKSGARRMTAYCLELSVGLAALLVQDTLLFFNYADGIYAFFTGIAKAVGLASYDFPSSMQIYAWALSVTALALYAVSWKRALAMTSIAFLATLALFTPAWPVVALLPVFRALQRRNFSVRTAPVLKRGLAFGAVGAVVGGGFVLLGQGHLPDAKNVGIFKSAMGITDPKALAKSDEPLFTNYFLQQSAMGRNVTTLSTITDAALTELDILYIVNPTKMPTRAEVASVDRFVRNGGALVLLTDHTDIGGVMRPSNAFLASTGMRVRFDSAIPNNAEWRWRYYGRYADESGMASEGELSMMGVSVGASLSVAPSARVWAVGDDAFSDIGNPKFGISRLGDTARNPTERQGGLALIASEPVGKGVVIAFGDTSTFQNGNTWRYGKELSGKIDFMRGQRLGPLGLQTVFAFCLVGVLALSVFAASPLPASLFCLAYFFTSAFVTRTGEPAYQNYVALDVGHVIKGLKRGEENGFDKVCYTFNKRGIPLIAVDSLQEAKDAKVLILPPSSRPYDASDVAMFRSLLEQGVVTLACGGFEDRLNLNRLSEPLGLTVSDTQLGAAHNASLTASAQAILKERKSPALVFKDAWSLKTDKDWQVLCESWGHPILATRNVGKGKLLVCGDSAFLETRTLEIGKEETLNFQFLDSWLSHAIN